MKRALFIFVLAFLTFVAPAVKADPPEQFSSAEVVGAGHRFFGGVSSGLAKAVEYAAGQWGQPTAYILGEEGSGAFVGGLRYGEGRLIQKNGPELKIYWQGPSLGFDFGGNGDRVMMLVYQMNDPHQLLQRFVGISGSAYFIGGVGITALGQGAITVAPIRSGVGARLGANLGYLKFTDTPTWNPF
ncbi:MAG: DUF1134 domain-containing protein [Pseudomonadota bacterium]